MTLSAFQSLPRLREHHRRADKVNSWRMGKGAMKGWIQDRTWLLHAGPHSCHGYLLKTCIILSQSVTSAWVMEEVPRPHLFMRGYWQLMDAGGRDILFKRCGQLIPVYIFTVLIGRSGVSKKKPHKIRRGKCWGIW